MHRAHATTTPEAAIFLVEGNGLREFYLGRIDDRYLDIGQERPHALQLQQDHAQARANLACLANRNR
jgi:hypothetical protein